MSSRSLSSAVALLAVLATPRAGRADERAVDEPPPKWNAELPPPTAPPAPKQGLRVGLVVAGSLTLAAAYTFPIAIAAEHDFANKGEWFAAPIVGPWAYLATQDLCDADGAGMMCGLGNAFLGTFVVVDGLSQVAGVAMLVAGLVVSPAPDRPKRRRAAATPTLVRVHGGWVAGAAGTF